MFPPVYSGTGKKGRGVKFITDTKLHINNDIENVINPPVFKIKLKQSQSNFNT